MAKDSTRTSAEQQRAAVALSTEDSMTASLAADAVGEAVGDTSGEKLKIRERLAYGVGDIGGNLIFAPISAFLLFYFTDTVGIGAAIAGTLLLFGRVLDGTMDLILGTLIDRTSTRWGKARPWILFSDAGGGDLLHPAVQHPGRARDRAKRSTPSSCTSSASASVSSDRTSPITRCSR